MKPPLSISIISWFLIVTSILGTVGSIITLNRMAEEPILQELLEKSPIPVPVQMALGFIGPIFNLIAGFAMLKRKNWGRLLYVIFSVLMFALGFITSPVKLLMIPSLIIFLIVVIFLFRPKANLFFNEQEHEIIA